MQMFSSATGDAGGHKPPCIDQRKQTAKDAHIGLFFPQVNKLLDMSNSELYAYLLSDPDLMEIHSTAAKMRQDSLFFDNLGNSATDPPDKGGDDE